MPYRTRYHVLQPLIVSRCDVTRYLQPAVIAMLVACAAAAATLALVHLLR